MRHTLAWLSLVALGGCKAENSLIGDDSDGDWDGAAGEDTGDWDADTDTAPPEDETDRLALPPAATDVYVFVANPERDTVTRINVRTLEVRTADVGAYPTKVLTSRDWTTAVAFNRDEDSVTILNTSTLEGRTVKVRDDLNDLTMSPDGRWVAVWHNRAAERPDDPVASGVQSFNEVSFVDLVSGAHHPMAVDYNPRSVEFTPDGAVAVVVTDTSLGVVDLTATTLVPRLVPVTDDLVDPPPAEEVVLSPDGSWAFVRQFGSSALVVVDLESADRELVPVGDNPTDLDLTPDGEHAVVVARGSQQVFELDVADPLATPRMRTIPDGAAAGAVLFDPTGRKAVLYTTATLTDRFVTWDLDADEMTLRSLVKPVASMAITPNGESLLVFHTKADAVDADSGSPFYGKWAITPMSLTDFRKNPLALPAEPTGYAHANSGDHGYFVMDGKKEFVELDYHTLLPEEIPLKSVPVYLGVLPDLNAADSDEPPAWISQEHDLGRISFWEPDDRTLRTITGFELNGDIEVDR